MRALEQSATIGALDELEPDPAIDRDGALSVGLRRRLFAELIGSAFLGALVIGSGIAAQRLSPGQPGLELLECAAVVGAGLYAIILMIGPVSGGHVNPIVSLVDASFGGLSWRDAFAYIPAQIAGVAGGAIVANAMFAQSAVSISTKHRASGGHLLAEVVATLGLLLVIFSLARTRRAASAPAAVGAYIAAACFFTSSSVCANPALAVGRMFSNSFAGFAPASVPGFVAAQIVGALLAIGVLRILYPDVTPQDAAQVLMPHAGRRAARHSGDALPAASAQEPPAGAQAGERRGSSPARPTRRRRHPRRRVTG
jgi:arsenate reductase